MWSPKPLIRILLAGPAALAAALAAMAAMPLWLPSGTAGIDNLILPLLLFPVIWSLTFFYAILEENLVRGSIAFAAVITVNAVPAVLAIQGS